MLALSATTQFHNNVVGSLMSQKSIPPKVPIINSCASMMNLDRPIVGTTTNTLDHHLIVSTSTDPKNHHPIISITSNPTNQVARKTQNTEGEPPFNLSEAPSIVVQF